MLIGITCNIRSTSKSETSSSHWLDEEEEFDSPETVEAIASALRSLGHEVEVLGDGEPMLRRLLDGPKPDLVFNFAEGRGVGRSREARVPGVLEMLEIPYTGSDPLTLAVTLDKDCAKRLVAAAGVPTPNWLLINTECDIPNGDNGHSAAASEFRIPKSELDALRLPVIVKPAFEGSSKGILNANLIYDRETLISTVRELCETYRQPILVEEFIDGDELTVGVIGNAPPEVIGIMRVVPLMTEQPFVYSLEVKRDWKQQVRYECPAKLSAADTKTVEQAALDAWKVLGCRDVSRVDFRLREGVPYFLEVNPLPGLSPESGDIVLLSRAVGIEHRELVARIVAAALERIEKSQCAQPSR